MPKVPDECESGLELNILPETETHLAKIRRIFDLKNSSEAATYALSVYKRLSAGSPKKSG